MKKSHGKTDDRYLEVCRAARANGWTIERTANGHTKLFHPNGKDIVVTGGTYSNRRGLKNFVAEMRRKGLVGI